MTKDLNRQICNIDYNYLNLPSRVEFLDGSKVLYTYDANGTKLRTDYYINPMTAVVPQAVNEQGASSTNLVHTWTDYCGNFIYENDTLKQTLIDGGYISYAHSQGTAQPTPVYHFYVQDHLGNNRLVVNENDTIEQINHYYPYGGLMGESKNLSSNQRYKYNGKELDRMHGLDWYDYGARFQNASVGRWSSVDPLAEDYYEISPYTYCANNPIIHIDIDGKFPLVPVPIIVGAVVGAGTEYIGQVAGNIVTEGMNVRSFTNVDVGDIAVAALVGAVTGGVSSINALSKAVKVGTSVAGEVVNAHYDVRSDNGRLSASVNNANKTANNLICAGLGKGAGKITGKFVSKAPTITKAGTNLSNNKISKTVKGLCPGISKKQAHNIAKSISPTTNRVLKRTKTVTDGIRRSSSEVSATTSGAVQGIVTNRDRK